MVVLFWKYLALIFISILLIACGGGGGSGGGSQSITYSGSTDPVAVTSGNAQEVALAPYTNSSASSGAVSLFATSLSAANSEGSGPGGSNVVSMLRSALSVVENIDLTSATKNYGVAKATVSDSYTEFGGCGGSSRVNITIDDQSGAFTGSLNFSNFCEYEVTLNGAMSFSGLIDLNFLTFDNMSFSFSTLRTQGLGLSMTMSGTITSTFTSFSSTSLANMVVRDDSTNDTFMLEDVELVLTTGAGYSELEMTGRFFMPEFGYADVTTPTALRVYDGNAWPSSGIVVATGANGVDGGATSARLSASTSTYQVEADTTGNGGYDYSETFNWE